MKLIKYFLSCNDITVPLLCSQLSLDLEFLRLTHQEPPFCNHQNLLQFPRWTDPQSPIVDNLYPYHRVVNKKYRKN